MAILPPKPAPIYVSGHYDGRAAWRPGHRQRRKPAAADPDGARRRPAIRTPRSTISRRAYRRRSAALRDETGARVQPERHRLTRRSCHVGEEQGLVGARSTRRGRWWKTPIEAVFNNDIVGNDRGGNGIDGATIRVYSEGPEDSPSRELARFVQRWVAMASHKVGDGAARSLRRAGTIRPTTRWGLLRWLPQSRSTTRHDVRDFRGAVARLPCAERPVNAAGRNAGAGAAPPQVLSDRKQPMITRAPTGYDANLNGMRCWPLPTDLLARQN